MKKIISVLLSAVIIVSLAAAPVNAAETNQSNATDYPYIFVHGMGGWAPDNPVYDLSPYWGGGLSLGSDTDLIKILNEQGIEAYAPSVGPLSSAWDRACELYAQLTGTVVDYGEAHSTAHNHDRYGFDYTGKATMGEPWDLKEKINLVGHSFGGATVRLLTSLLAYGDADEIAATGDETSALFTGGHNCVHSCITLSAPHNGSQVANMLVDPQLLLLMSAAINVIGTVFGNNFLVFSFQLSQFGITPGQDQSRAFINPSGVWNFYATNDNCGYDMTLRGAAELNEKIKLAPDTYYYSYTTANTKEGNLIKCQLPDEGLSPIFYISSMMLASTKGLTIDGIKIEGDWEVNDGIVPLASAIYPSCDADTALSYEAEIEKGNEIKPGRWYYFKPMTGMDHFDFCGTQDYPMGFEEFYFGMINTANSY